MRSPVFPWAPIIISCGEAESASVDGTHQPLGRWSDAASDNWLWCCSLLGFLVMALINLHTVSVLWRLPLPCRWLPLFKTARTHSATLADISADSLAERAPLRI